MIPFVVDKVQLLTTLWLIPSDLDLKHRVLWEGIRHQEVYESRKKIFTVKIRHELIITCNSLELSICFPNRSLFSFSILACESATI